MAAQQSPVFRAGTHPVPVSVTVTDRSGWFVHGLTAEQFGISEDGTRRAVAQFSAGRVPVSLGILLDIGGSMTPGPKVIGADDARWAGTRRALEVLVAVRTKDTRLRVRARTGYTAPSATPVPNP